MTQEDKQLLLKDLSARWLYGTIISVTDGTIKFNAYIESVSYKNIQVSPVSDSNFTAYTFYKISEIKPYLRPMSSMTEEEKWEIYDWLVETDIDWFDFSKLRLDEILISFDSSWLLVDWLNKKMFDYRGLIPKGLALEAPEGMYNLKVR